MADATRMDEALDRAMREQRLEPWHREAALGLLEAPPSEWAPCCGNACEPCTLVLRRVVERARALMAEATVREPVDTDRISRDG